MTPTLIALVLLAAGVAIVAFVTRRKPVETTASHPEQDTAWGDPISPADATLNSDEVKTERPAVETRS